MTNPTDEQPEQSNEDDEAVDNSRGVSIGPMEILSTAAKERRGGVFAALGCVLVIGVCCVGGVSGVVGWGALRYAALGEARDKVGVPDGWELVDDSRWPWAAHATTEGPADAAAVTTWLGRVGVDASTNTIQKCLTEVACTVLGRVNGFDVTIEYGPDRDGRSTASVTVD